MILRILFLFISLTIALLASSERKIIIGSYATEREADHALKAFQSKLDSSFLATQKESGFHSVARASGRQFIIALEPFKSYRAAKKIKKILPKEYASAFINRYTPPKSALLVALNETDTAVVKEAITQEKTPEIQKELKVPESPMETLTQKSTPQHDVNTTVDTLKSTTEKKVSKAPQESPYIIDAKSMKSIDVKSAYYVIGGQTYGIMSPSGKFAFSTKEAAEEFAKQYGGTVVDYETSNEEALKKSVK